MTRFVSISEKGKMLDAIKEHLSMPKNADFARFLGISSQAVSNWYSRNTFDAELIYTKCDFLNPDWILTGREPMLKFTQEYIDTFNRIFEESIPLTDLTFDQMGEYCGIRKERMRSIYMRQAKMDDSEIGMIATKMGLNLPWVLNGLGDQFIHGKFDKETFMKEYNEYYNTTHATPATHPGEGIPLIPINAMAGVLTAEQTVLDYECERYVVPMFKGADFLIPVKGSSMYPKYSSGDIVACQRVPMGDLFFQWNKVYVIDTNQGALIKRIKPGSDKDHILIVSDNEKYDPFELPYSAIHGVALVVGVIRLE